MPLTELWKVDRVVVSGTGECDAQRPARAHHHAHISECVPGLKPCAFVNVPTTLLHDHNLMRESDMHKEIGH